VPEVIPRWRMQCHNTAPPHGEHQIEIPTPKHLELRADLLQLERANLETVFACPQCGHVSSYRGSEALCWQKSPSEGQDTPPDPRPLCIELSCVVEGCSSRTKVRTAGREGETSEMVRDRIRSGVFCVTMTCGHQLSYPKDANLEVLEGSNAAPF